MNSIILRTATRFALRRQVRQPDFDRLLGQLPEGAVAYWSVPGADPRDLARRIF